MPPVAPLQSVSAAKTTRFETATGVELAHQFGLRYNYDNLRTIKGLKFVSADGIYSNGFAIANGAFLVHRTRSRSTICSTSTSPRSLNLKMIQSSDSGILNTIQKSISVCFCFSIR